MYYNKKMPAEPGYKIPAGKQFGQTEFLDLVKKTRSAGITPIASGGGDRPYPGAFLPHEALLKNPGVDGDDKLLKCRP